MSVIATGSCVRKRDNLAALTPAMPPRKRLKSSSKQSAAARIQKLQKQFPLCDKATIWQSYIVRKSDWNKKGGYGSNSSQKQYGSHMHQVVEMAATLVASHDSPERILAFVAHCRRRIAYALHHKNAKDYGVTTWDSARTSCDGLYEELGVKLLAMHQNSSSKNKSHELSYGIAARPSHHGARQQSKSVAGEVF